jgi:hypothetical protein
MKEEKKIIEAMIKNDFKNIKKLIDEVYLIFPS